MTVAAVVVSYNRKDLLEKCLVALEGQTRPLDEIIVIDNSSTDGAPELVKESFPEVKLFDTGSNVGGAGGFAWGVELAIAHGHEYAWLMDDDAEPELDALEPLMELAGSASEPYSFLASMVTLGGHTINTGNPPVFSNDISRQVSANLKGAIAIDAATFVGVLVNLDVARQTHLPQRDFFIWVDDTEYTLRLSRIAPAVMVRESRIKHPLSKSGSNDMGWRLFYFLRNKLWLIRTDPQMSLQRKAFEILGFVGVALLQGPHAADKKLWVRSVIRGAYQGFFRSARKEIPGTLLDALSPTERAAALELKNMNV
ncbi:glycosyltransferase family 2 protein [Pseudarthrobacter sp. BRE9]|uniref:glycosyltransferase family 2 protein n=1 Tax=Pseudarthrobacter sp. BRE9 TaxID=2962582 RepID=UPI002882120C|nr:glycosyltransferase family 2 protein [Pseudarthrobacter sp. BRE9]MDT0167625.1 glycosyltransferase family 2 protein [Pseudarthrobacter sp. BRE9]